MWGLCDHCAIWCKGLEPLGIWASGWVPVDIQFPVDTQGYVVIVKLMSVFTTMVEMTPVNKVSRRKLKDRGCLPLSSQRQRLLCTSSSSPVWVLLSTFTFCYTLIPAVKIKGKVWGTDGWWIRVLTAGPSLKTPWLFTEGSCSPTGPVQSHLNFCAHTAWLHQGWNC